MKIIGYIYTDFPEKFGVPRQSNLVPELPGRIELTKEYNHPDFVRGIEEFEYLWLLWRFDVPASDRATVRPPKLGGNTKLGVFATRSPFRPNPVGLSSVKLESVEITDHGPVLYVSGVDMRNKTAIYDIKPYLAYCDSHPCAKGSFAQLHQNDALRVVIPDDLCHDLDGELLARLRKVLSMDPRPQYQNDPDRVYGMDFSGYNVHFTVTGDTLVVTDIAQIHA